MDNKELEKKFSDKKFLKSNELQNLAGNAVVFIKENKNLVVAGVVVLVVIGLAIPGLKFYRTQQITDFNKKLYQADKGLKKVQKYQSLLKDFSSLPAAQYVRLKLIDEYIEHSEVEKAEAEIQAGLKTPERSIFKTLLVLKQVGRLKKNQKFKEAADFILAHETKVIPPFLGRLRMIRADLLLLAGQKDSARALYQQLGNFEGAGAEGESALVDFDPQLANEAKDQVLLIDLGII